MHAPALANSLRLVVITDTDVARPRSVLDVVRAAVRAGATAVQLRDKAASPTEIFEAGRAMLPIVHESGALFFVNDRTDVALALGADGVHLGPDDVPVSAVRAKVPKGFLIGTSADEPAVAKRLVAEGADYVGCGAVYPTPTKSDAGAVIGLSGLQQVVATVHAPVVGIGGITVARAAEVATTGAAGIAVVAAVMAAPDVSKVVRRLLAPWE